MPTSDFLDPRDIARDLDRPWLASLPDAKPPVFVLGLHRSGTTFLYQLLAEAFPVAVSTVYHVTHYKRLVASERAGLVGEQHAEIRAYLAERGISNRGIDAFPVGPEGLEEHAFILRKHSRDWHFTARNARLFDEMLRKLSALQPEGQALLLKNPHDLLVPDDLQSRYPHAKFVFIRRDPVRVLNSQFRNSFLYRARPEPYLQLLLAGIPLWRLAFAAMTAADRVLPDPLYQRLLLDGLRRSIRSQLTRHYQALGRMARSNTFELHYEALIEDPPAMLSRLQAFLELPFRSDVSLMPAAPRLEPLQPGVAAAASAFRAQLAGLPDATIAAG